MCSLCGGTPCHGFVLLKGAGIFACMFLGDELDRAGIHIDFTASPSRRARAKVRYCAKIVIAGDDLATGEKSIVASSRTCVPSSKLMAWYGQNGRRVRRVLEPVCLIKLGASSGRGCFIRICRFLLLSAVSTCLLLGGQRKFNASSREPSVTSLHLAGRMCVCAICFFLGGCPLQVGKAKGTLLLIQSHSSRGHEKESEAHNSMVACAMVPELSPHQNGRNRTSQMFRRAFATDSARQAMAQWQLTWERKEPCEGCIPLNASNS